MVVFDVFLLNQSAILQPFFIVDKSKRHEMLVFDISVFGTCRSFVTGSKLYCHLPFVKGQSEQHGVPGGASGVRRARNIQLSHGGHRGHCCWWRLPTPRNRPHPHHLPAAEHTRRAHLPQAADPA